MMQGDACNLGISILNNGGHPLRPGDVQDVEITIGPMRKTYRRGELSFAGDVWLFPVSQRESFGCSPGPLRAQVRVVWPSGVVEGCTLYGVAAEESISKEVL